MRGLPLAFSCDPLIQFCFTLSTTFTRIAIVGEYFSWARFSRIFLERLLATFIMRAYVVVPKVFIAYACIALLSVIGLVSIVFDVVCFHASQGFRDFVSVLRRCLTRLCQDANSTNVVY